MDNTMGGQLEVTEFKEYDSANKPRVGAAGGRN